MQEERRKFTRHPLECPVTILTSRGSISGHTKNLSADGAYIYCQKLLNPKERMELSIEFPDGDIMEVPCKMVWSCTTPPKNSRGFGGIGVHFLR